MTQISTIHTELISLIGTALSTYTLIANPYAIEDNPIEVIGDAYGIGFGPGDNTNRYVGCKMSIIREISIPIIRKVTTTQSNKTQRQTLEKDIFEDQLVMIKAFENDPSLNGSCIQCQWVSDDGLEYIESDTQKYFLLTNILSAEYSENLP